MNSNNKIASPSAANNTDKASKTRLRQEFRRAVELEHAHPDVHAINSQHLNKRLCALFNTLMNRGLDVAGGAVWGGFQSIAFEPDVRQAMQDLADNGLVRWAFPRVRGDDLEFYLVSEFSTLVANSWGILEPDPAKCGAPVHLHALRGLLIPGVAFDLEGQRLGRGRGFYDRTLSKINLGTIKIGVGFEAQLSQAPLPVESFDVPMDWVVTEARAFECENSPDKPSAAGDHDLQNEMGRKKV